MNFSLPSFFGGAVKFLSLSGFAFFVASSWSLLGQAQVTSGQSYRILSACATDKVLSISSASTANEAAVVLATRNTSQKSQIFQFNSSSTAGAYTIIAQNSGKALDIYKASTALNAPLQQFTLHGKSNQQFRIERSADGFLLLKNVNSGLYVNLANANPTVGNILEQYSNVGSCAQKYKLESVAPAPTPTSTPTPTPTPTPVPPPAATRDPLKQPFASSSIWNRPIGSGAVYAPANLSGNPGGDPWAPMPQTDQEQIVLRPTAPLTNIYYSDAGWSGRNRCGATGGVLIQVPMPSSYIVPNRNDNSSAVFLMADKRTLIHTQPFARCNVGSYGTSIVKFDPVDIFGDGILGSHGGSGMSAIGGSIRLGELRPGSQGPRHALKVNVYAKEALYRCSSYNNCYRWPARAADSYAVGFYGAANGNSNTAMKMGALLAIPASTNIANLGMETEPGRQLAWTLQNYGAYIVDDTYGPAFAINVENGADGSKPAEFRADYGFDMDQRVNGNTAWMRDMQRLVRALSVVNNNGPNSIGGGGTPRQPLAPEMAP
jgi:hypothetical protein